MIEIERTYLVKNLPNDLGSYKKVEIKQGYFSELPSPLRIRQKDDYFELTKKFPKNPGDQSTHDEINLPIKKEEFERLWPFSTKSLEKTRYFIPLADGLTGEFDVFHGKLQGLVFVEVEFPSRDSMGAFQPPEWFGRDITDEQYSANVFLAGKTYQEIKSLIGTSMPALMYGEAL